MNNQTYTPVHKFNGGNPVTLCIGCNNIITYGVVDILYCNKCTEPSERYLKELMIKNKIKDETNNNR